MPLPGPPLENVQCLRDICHIEACSTLGSDESIAMLMAPVPSFTYRIFFQVLPPSVVLNTPRSGLDAINQTSFKAMRARANAHPIEDVGAKLRAMMPWIGKNKLVDKAKN